MAQKGIGFVSLLQLLGNVTVRPLQLKGPDAPSSNCMHSHASKGTNRHLLYAPAAAAGDKR
jgi:hypothetical protein